MPINVPTNLPAVEELKKEYIFIMEESRALHQDIRPLRIALLNLMPLKMVTETDLLRVHAGQFPRRRTADPQRSCERCLEQHASRLVAGGVNVRDIVTNHVHAALVGGKARQSRKK